MKKHYYLMTIAALIALIALPAISQADDGNVSIDTQTSVNTSVSVDNPGQLPPPLQGQQNGAPGSIRDRIRADYQARLANVRNNQDSRNTMMERRLGSTTVRGSDDADNQENDSATGTEEFRMGMMPREARSALASSTMMGTTTMRGRFERGENNGRDMRLGMFEMRRQFVTKELDVAVRNLNNIRGRLDSRIQKEQSAGHDMSAGISALALADIKIKVASDAVTALEAYLPTASSTANASTTVNIDTARNLISDAKKAIKDAQGSLNNVVIAIAHALGLKLDTDEHAEATTTASTTSQ